MFHLLIFINKFPRNIQCIRWPEKEVKIDNKTNGESGVFLGKVCHFEHNKESHEINSTK